MGSTVAASEEEDGSIDDEGVAFVVSSEIERFPCKTFSRRYELRTNPAVSGVLRRLIKD